MRLGAETVAVNTEIKTHVQRTASLSVAAGQWAATVRLDVNQDALHVTDSGHGCKNAKT